MQKRIGLTCLVSEFVLGLGALILLLLIFRDSTDFLSTSWPYILAIGAALIASMALMISWLLKWKNRATDDEGNQTGDFRLLTRRLPIFAIILLAVSLGAYYLGTLFVNYPIGQGKGEAITRAILAHFAGVGTSMAVSLVATLLYLRFLPFLTKSAKRDLVLPLISILLFEGFLRGTFGLYTSISRPLAGFLGLFAIGVLASLTIALIVYARAKESTLIGGKTSFDDPKTTLGRKIRNARVGKGINQKQLGKLTGLSKAEVFEIELGTLKPTRRTLLRISEVLDIDFTSEEWAEAEIQENDAKAD